MRLKALELGPFQSFDKKSRIELPETGLILIVGKNEDTGGSSGAGKSSIARALRHASGDCELPATALQSWFSEDSAWSSAEFDTATLTRGKKLDITLPDGPVHGSAAQKKEKIDVLFGGLDSEMRTALTYRRQKSPGLFLSRTDSEKKAFMTKVLGLEPYEAEAEKASKKATELETQLISHQGLLAGLEKELSELDVSGLDDAEKCVADIEAEIHAVTAQIKALRTQHDEARRTHDASLAAYVGSRLAVQAQADKAVQEAQASTPTPALDDASLKKAQAVADICSTRLKKLEAEDDVRRQALDAQRAAKNKTLQALNLLVGQARPLTAEVTRLEAQLLKMVGDDCPTCERPWERAGAERAKIELALTNVRTQLQKAVDAKADVTVVTNDIQELPRFEPDPNIEKFKRFLVQAQADVASERQKLSQVVELARAETGRKVAELKAVASAVKAETEAAARVMAEARAKDLQVLESQSLVLVSHSNTLQKNLNFAVQDRERLRSIAARKAKTEAALTEAQAKADALKTEAGAEKDFAALVGRDGFLGLIFDEVLAEISDETNKVLGAVANTRHVTVTFASEFVTQAGKVNRDIKPVVTVGGHETTLSGLSGGMATAVDLAVDLAVGDVVSRRAGFMPNWFFLDEGLEGLDSVSKESVMEMLQIYARNRLILVVDHASEFQSLFSRQIVVRYKDGRSWIE